MSNPRQGRIQGALGVRCPSPSLLVRGSLVSYPRQGLIQGEEGGGLVKGMLTTRSSELSKAGAFKEQGAGLSPPLTPGTNKGALSYQRQERLKIRGLGCPHPSLLEPTTE